jgi:hypothetical protein
MESELKGGSCLQVAFKEVRAGKSLEEGVGLKGCLVEGRTSEVVWKLRRGLLSRSREPVVLRVEGERGLVGKRPVDGEFRFFLAKLMLLLYFPKVLLREGCAKITLHYMG